jgi:hypothetical protein
LATILCGRLFEFLSSQASVGVAASTSISVVPKTRERATLILKIRKRKEL